MSRIHADEGLHLICAGPGEISVTGGEATTVVERLMLDLVGEVRDSLDMFNEAIPYRYDFDSSWPSAPPARSTPSKAPSRC